MSPNSIQAIPIVNFPIIQSGDDLAKVIAHATLELMNGDILVIASKVVSISENRIIRGEDVQPSRRAMEIASENGFDPLQVELAIQESVELIRTKGVLITENKNGLVCNFSGVDKSNAPEGSYILLPENPDASAERIHASLVKKTGKKIAVIISDTQGRPWRKGSVNISIGTAGIAPFKYNKGKQDLYGRELKRSTICQADEIAMLVEPLMGQAGEQTPVVIVRGYDYQDSDETSRDINRPKHEDMFR
jgi:coenzyme F420-0:L-glutamate ligase/coenzyme F420-1:gamma-L-glutamate ligase